MHGILASAAASRLTGHAFALVDSCMADADFPGVMTPKLEQGLDTRYASLPRPDAADEGFAA